jgi:hypothetical protein
LFVISILPVYYLDVLCKTVHVLEGEDSLKKSEQNRIYFYFRAGTGLALAFLLGLAGFFPAYGEDDAPYAGLTGFWSNNLYGRAEKTLRINADDMSFAASLDPGMGRGLISGKIAVENGEYVLQELVETTGRFWGFAVKSFNGVPVQVFLHGGDIFELKCEENKMVETFFGGSFYRAGR